MNKYTRLAAIAVPMVILLAGCGSPQQVEVSSPGATGGVATPAKARQAATTTTVAPNTVPLTEVTVVGEGTSPMAGPIKISAKVYDDSAYQSFGCGAGFLWVFDLNRGYTKFNATLGLDDNSVSTDEATIRFFGDNNTALGEQVVKFGEPKPIEVNLNNALRLRIEVTRNSGTCIRETGYSTTVGFGDARLTKITQ